MIFYLIGKSSTGKDSILNALLEDGTLGLKKIVQYATRPIRDGEAEGREYHFITLEKSAELEDAGLVIESRTYNTVYGIWKYMMVDDGRIVPGERYAAVGTIESYAKVRDYFGTDKVFPIYIDVETGERLQRALDRERTHDNPKYAEMCRRFLADEADFTDERLEAAGLKNPDGSIVHCVENNDFSVCLSRVKALIREAENA